MEDLIAVSALAMECVIATLVAHYLGVALPFGIAAIVFVVLTFIGLGVPDKNAVEGQGPTLFTMGFSVVRIS